MTKEEEYQLASKIDEVTNFNCRIIRNEDQEPYTLFCATDIAEFIDLKRVRTSTLPLQDKINIKTITSGGEQLVTFITYNGLLKILTKSRKQSIYDFACAVGINMKNTSFASIETSSINCICKTFAGEDMIKQYRVNNYKIDLYFPNKRLAIECDEEFHRKTSCIAEDVIREESIKSQLNCTFIRYQPYAKDFDMFALLNKIYIHLRNHIK